MAEGSSEEEKIDTIIRLLQEGKNEEVNDALSNLHPRTLKMLDAGKKILEMDLDEEETLAKLATEMKIEEEKESEDENFFKFSLIPFNWRFWQIKFEDLNAQDLLYEPELSLIHDGGYFMKLFKTPKIVEDGDDDVLQKVAISFAKDTEEIVVKEIEEKKCSTSTSREIFKILKWKKEIFIEDEEDLVDFAIYFRRDKETQEVIALLERVPCDEEEWKLMRRKDRRHRVWLMRQMGVDEEEIDKEIDKILDIEERSEEKIEGFDDEDCDEEEFSEDEEDYDEEELKDDEDFEDLKAQDNQ